MITNRTKQSIVITVLYFVGSIVVAGLVIQQTAASGAELESQMEVVGKSKIRQERYDDLLKILEQSSGERDQLRRYLLTEGSTVRFLTETESLAKRMGVTLITDSLSVKELPNPDFKTIDLNLRAQGTKEAVSKFLSVLETLPYYSRVNGVTFSALKNESGSDWEATIKLVVGLYAYDR